MADPTCSASGCDRPVKIKAKRLCSRHYDAERRATVRHPPGSPGALRFLARIAAKSVEHDGCIEWVGKRTRTGYGQTSFQGAIMGVHRAAWIARHGPIPAETPCVLHHCDNPPCWRDDHLFLGTQADNNRDMTAKGRHWNSQKNVCNRGHEYTPENTITYSGHRRCRTCFGPGGSSARQRAS